MAACFPNELIFLGIHAPSSDTLRPQQDSIVVLPNFSGNRLKPAYVEKFVPVRYGAYRLAVPPVIHQLVMSPAERNGLLQILINMVIPLFREKMSDWYEGIVDHDPHFKSGGSIQRKVIKNLSEFILAPEMRKTGLRSIRSVGNFVVHHAQTQPAFALLQLSTDMRGIENLRSFANRDKWTVNTLLTLPAAMNSVTTVDHRLLGMPDTYISTTNGIFSQALSKYGLLDNIHKLSVSFPWLLHVLRPLLLTHHRALETSTLSPLSSLIIQLLREEVELGEAGDKSTLTRQQKHEAALHLQQHLLLTGIAHNDSYNNNIQHLQSFLHRIDLIPTTSLGDFSFESIPSHHSFQRVTARTKSNMALHTLPPDFYPAAEGTGSSATAGSSKRKKKRARSEQRTETETEADNDNRKLADLGPFFSSRPEYSSPYTSHTGSAGDEEMLLSRTSRKKLRLGHLLTQSQTLDKQHRQPPHHSTTRRGITMRSNITSNRQYQRHTGDSLASTARDMSRLYHAHSLPIKRIRLGEHHLPNTPMTIVDYLDPYDGMRMHDNDDMIGQDEDELEEEKELAAHLRSLAADKLLQHSHTESNKNSNKKQRLEQQFDHTADHALAIVMQELTAETMRRWYRSGSSAPLAFASETVLPLQGARDNDIDYHEKMVQVIAKSTARAQASMNTATSLLAPQKKLLNSRMHMLLGPEYRPRNMYANQVKAATTSALSENAADKHYGHLGMLLNHHATRVSALQEQQDVILEPEKGLTTAAVFEGAVKSRYAPKRVDMNKLPTYIKDYTKPKLLLRRNRTSNASSVSSKTQLKKRKRTKDDEDESDSIEFINDQGEDEDDDDEGGDSELNEERRRYAAFLATPQESTL